MKNDLYGAFNYGPTFSTDIYMKDQPNINTISGSQIFSYTLPTYPSGSDQNTFQTGGFQNFLTTKIEVYQLF